MRKRTEKGRRSIRLRGFDYHSARTYYLTLCLQDRVERFGRIVGGKLVLSKVGEMAKEWWLRIPSKFIGALLDDFVLMPNHMHALLRFERTKENAGHQPFSLGDTIQWFKTMSTNEYIRRVTSEGWPRFNKRLWQRDYYEHLIRSEEELFHARGYILRNPEKWSLDRENAAHVGIDPDDPELLFASEEE